MKRLLAAFGVLDALQLLLILWIGHFLPSWARAAGDPGLLLVAAGRIVFLVTLAFTAWGLIRRQRWVVAVCFGQFALRVWIGAYTLSWLEIVAEHAGMPVLLPAIFWLAVGFEVTRLLVLSATYWRGDLWR